MHNSLNKEKKEYTPYINALGNLGMKKSAETLLEIVRGDTTMDSYTRYLAVVKLSKSVWINPAIFKKSIMAIIENEAEDPQVFIPSVCIISLNILIYWFIG